MRLRRLQASIQHYFFCCLDRSISSRIIIKQQEEIRRKTTGKRLTGLFKLEDIDKDKVYKTRYHAFVGNQQLPAIEIWEQYKRRGDAENRIKELKEDFGGQVFCMDDFCATETAMRL